MKSVNLYPSLRPVLHEDSNDNEEFIANNPPYIVSEFCRYPMPVKYELMPVQHTDVTAARNANCPGNVLSLPSQPLYLYWF